MEARERILEELFVLTRGNDDAAAENIDDLEERLQQYVDSYKDMDQEKLAAYLDKNKLM